MNRAARPTWHGVATTHRAPNPPSVRYSFSLEYFVLAFPSHPPNGELVVPEHNRLVIGEFEHNSCLIAEVVLIIPTRQPVVKARHQVIDLPQLNRDRMRDWHVNAATDRHTKGIAGRRGCGRAGCTSSDCVCECTGVNAPEEEVEVW